MRLAICLLRTRVRRRGKGFRGKKRRFRRFRFPFVSVRVPRAFADGATAMARPTRAPRVRVRGGVGPVPRARDAVDARVHHRRAGLRAVMGEERVGRRRRLGEGGDPAGARAERPIKSSRLVRLRTVRSSVFFTPRFDARRVVKRARGVARKRSRRARSVDGHAQSRARLLLERHGVPRLEPLVLREAPPVARQAGARGVAAHGPRASPGLAVAHERERPRGGRQEVGETRRRRQAALRADVPGQDDLDERRPRGRVPPARALGGRVGERVVGCLVVLPRPRRARRVGVRRRGRGRARARPQRQPARRSHDRGGGRGHDDSRRARHLDDPLLLHATHVRLDLHVALRLVCQDGRLAARLLFRHRGRAR